MKFENFPVQLLENDGEGPLKRSGMRGEAPFLPNRSIDARKLRSQEARQSGPTRSFGHGFSTLLSKKCIEWAAFFFCPLAHHLLSFEIGIREPPASVSFGRAKERTKKSGMELSFIRAIGTQFKGIKNIAFFLYRSTTIFE
jgi:hypothetical protein